jgi:hypothetical protein
MESGDGSAPGVGSSGSGALSSGCEALSGEKEVGAAKAGANGEGCGTPSAVSAGWKAAAPNGLGRSTTAGGGGGGRGVCECKAVCRVLSLRRSWARAMSSCGGRVCGVG